MKALREALAPLRSWNFVCMWLGQGISVLGDECFDIALIWLLIGLTGSTVLIGAVLTATYIPTIMLLLVGGAFADRLNQRGILLVSDILRTIVTFIFALLVTTSHISIGEIFVFSLLYGLVSAFTNPTLSALFPSLVPESQYNAANVLRQVTTQSATLLGPALGGFLVARYSIALALAFDAATFAASVFFVLVMRSKKRPASAQAAQAAQSVPSGDDAAVQPAKKKSSLRETFFGGAKFLLGEPGVFVMLMFFSLVNGLNDVMAVLVPVLTRQVLHLSAATFGLLGSCLGVGTLGGALVMGIIGQRVRHRVLAIFGGMGILGAAIVAMGLAQNANTLYIAFFIVGVSFIVPEILSSTLLQLLIPAGLRGRVFGFSSMVAMGLNPLGMLLAGVLGQAFGVRQGLWIGGGAIVMLSLLSFLVPTVRRLDHHPALHKLMPGK